MTSLFIDTSHHLHLGLLDAEENWLDYFHKLETKNASTLHSKIYDMCSASGLSVKNIERVYLGMGPGSYTGIRIAEGVGQIFSIASVESFSFYHFDIPKIIGVQKGIWLSKAFKGEYFLFQWENEQVSQGLKKDYEVESYLKIFLDQGYQIFTNCVESIDVLDCPIVETSRLIKDFSSIIFPSLLKNKSTRSPFYYRTLEEEFSVTVPDC